VRSTVLGEVCVVSLLVTFVTPAWFPSLGTCSGSSTSSLCFSCVLVGFRSTRCPAMAPVSPIITHPPSLPAAKTSWRCIRRLRTTASGYDIGNMGAIVSTTHIDAMRNHVASIQRWEKTSKAFLVLRYVKRRCYCFHDVCKGAAHACRSTYVAIQAAPSHKCVNECIYF
jgi:hypothetical protein